MLPPWASMIDRLIAHSHPAFFGCEKSLKQVLLYVIGIDDDNTDTSRRRRPKYHIYDYMLDKLTHAGSGRLIRLYTGKNYDLRDLAGVLLGELHQEYTMGYYPAAGTGNGDWRNVEVQVTKPGAQILSRN